MKRKGEKRGERGRGRNFFPFRRGNSFFCWLFFPLSFAGRNKKTHFFLFSLPLLSTCLPSGMQAADARSECTVIAARMQTGPCAKLQDATMVSVWLFRLRG